MSKKDYVALAALVKGLLDGATNPSYVEGVANVARMYAKVAVRDNPNFDAARFFLACGIEEAARS